MVVNVAVVQEVTYSTAVARNVLNIANYIMSDDTLLM